MNYWYLILLFFAIIIIFYLISLVFDELDSFSDNVISKNSILKSLIKLVTLSLFSFFSVYLYSLIPNSDVDTVNILFPVIAMTALRYGLAESLAVFIFGFLSFFLMVEIDVVNNLYFIIYYSITFLVVALLSFFAKDRYRKRNFFLIYILQMIIIFAFVFSIYAIKYTFDKDLIGEFFYQVTIRSVVESSIYFIFIFSTYIFYNYLSNKSNLYNMSNFDKYSSLNNYIGREYVKMITKKNNISNAFIFVIEDNIDGSDHESFFEDLRKRYPDIILFKHIKDRYAFFLPYEIEDITDFKEDKIVKDIYFYFTKHTSGNKMSYSVYGLHSHSLNELLLMADYNIDSGIKLYDHSNIIESNFLINSSKKVKKRHNISNIRTGLFGINFDDQDYYIPVMRYKNSNFSIDCYSVCNNYNEEEYILRRNNFLALKDYILLLKEGKVNRDSFFIVLLNGRICGNKKEMKKILNKIDNLGVLNNVKFGLLYNGITHNHLPEDIEFLVYNERFKKSSIEDMKNLNHLYISQ